MHVLLYDTGTIDYIQYVLASWYLHPEKTYGGGSSDDTYSSTRFASMRNKAKFYTCVLADFVFGLHIHVIQHLD